MKITQLVNVFYIIELFFSLKMTAIHFVMKLRPFNHDSFETYTDIHNHQLLHVEQSLA